MALHPPALVLTEADLKLMLAAGVHHGTKNLDPQMERYVWKRRSDGIHLINLGKTWEKLVLAARAIVAIENPLDVIAISGRPYGQRAVFKFAQHTGSNYIGTRYTPGTFTNQLDKRYLEPRLLIVTDPLVDHQPVLEASYANLPCIAFTDTDSPVTHVDIAIPCNNKSKNSIALMYWLLAREVLRMRAQISRQEKWDVMVDLFLYRDPEETDKAEEGEEAKGEEAAPHAQPAAGDQWQGAPAETSGVPVAHGGFDQFQAPAGGQANWQPQAAPAGWGDEQQTAF